jgi:hypothetical protein
VTFNGLWILNAHVEILICRKFSEY